MLELLEIVGLAHMKKISHELELAFDLNSLWTMNPIKYEDR
jgi:hypothetical protein